MNRIAAGFETLTGQDRRQGSMALLYLRCLMIKGRATARAKDLPPDQVGFAVSHAQLFTLLALGNLFLLRRRRMV